MEVKIQSTKEWPGTEAKKESIKILETIRNITNQYDKIK